MDKSATIPAKADRLENETTTLTRKQIDFAIGTITSDLYGPIGTLSIAKGCKQNTDSLPLKTW